MKHSCYPRWVLLSACVCLVGFTPLLAQGPIPEALKAWPANTGANELSWIYDADPPNPPDPTHFVVQRAPDDDGVPGTWGFLLPTANGASRSYVDNLADSKTKYHYRIKAIGGGAEDEWSNIATAVSVYVGLPLSDWVDVTSAPYFADPLKSSRHDDGAKIQLAIDDHIKNGAPQRVLYFPNGNYEVKSTIKLNNYDPLAPQTIVGAHIVGESKGGVVLRWLGMGEPAVMQEVCSGDTNVSCGTQTRFDPDDNKYCYTGTDTNCQYASQSRSFCGTVEEPNVLFSADGTPSAILRNITWANEVADDHVILLDMSAAHELYQANSLVVDNVFKNGWIGLRLGGQGKQDSEVTVRRSEFSDNDFGVSLEDYNALNHWFWDCRFLRNERAAMTNMISHLGDPSIVPGDPGNPADADLPRIGGDFRVMRGYFEENERDAWIAPTGGFTFRECKSKKSGQFLYSHGANSSANLTTVIDTQIDEFDRYGEYCGAAIEVETGGPLFLIDNKIDSFLSTMPPVYGSVKSYTDIVALGNEYTTSTPYGGGHQRLEIVNPPESVVIPFTVTDSEPTVQDLVGTHPVFTVTDAGNFQDVIDAAEAYPGRAVVHVPSGVYDIYGTLRVGANSNLMIVGNGPASELRWKGPDGGTVLEIDGEGTDGVVIRDLYIQACRLDQSGSGSSCDPGQDARAIGIRVINADQPDARALLNRFHSSIGAGLVSVAAIELDGADQLGVDIVDFSSVLNQDLATALNGVVVTAGSELALESMAKAVWSGNLVNHETDYRITNNIEGVRFLSTSARMEKSGHYLWAEGSSNPAFDSDGDICIHGGAAGNKYTAVSDIFHVKNFKGNVGILNMEMKDHDAVDDPPRSNFTPIYLQQEGSPATNIEMVGNIVFGLPDSQPVGAANVVKLSRRYDCNTVYSQDPFYDPGAFDPSWPYPACTECSLDGQPCDPNAGIGEYLYCAGDCKRFVTVPLPNENEAGNDDLVTAGFALLRELELPAFYDEAEAIGTFQLVIDGVKVTNAHKGIVVTHVSE